MDTKEILTIARTFSDAIIQQGLTKAELVMLNSLINEMTAHKLETTPEEVLDKNSDTPSKPLPPIVKKSKSIQYDDDPSSPTYDPAPQMEIERVPPRVEATGKVIAYEGSACTCKKCGRIVYTVIRDITDNCKASAFFESFAPFGKAPAMLDRVNISNAEGKISIDCPMCDDTKKSLYLVGSAPGVNQGGVISV